MEAIVLIIGGLILVCLAAISDELKKIREFLERREKADTQGPN